MLNSLRQTYGGLERSVYFLFLAQIINSMGHFVRPFLALFLTRKLGLSPAETGIVVWIAALAWVPSSLLGGKLADSYARKSILLIFQGLAAISLIPCAFLGNSLAIPVLLIVSSFFQGVAEPVNDAMITDITSRDQRKTAFSLLYLGHNMGFAIGPMVAGFLFTNYMSWLFIGDALTTLAALALVAKFTSETRPDEKAVADSLELPEDNPERAEKGSVFGILVRRPLLLGFMLVFMLYSFVYSQVGFGIPLQLADTFGEKGSDYYGILMAVNAVVVVLLTTRLLKMTGPVLPVLTVAIAGIFYALGFGFLGRTDSFFLILLLTVLWTVGEILSATNASAYIANHAPITHRGRISAVAPLIMYSGEAAGPPLAGWFIDLFSVNRIWDIALIISLGASCFMFLLYALERHRN